MSPFASPIERSRTPGNTDTAIFDLGEETAHSGAHIQSLYSPNLRWTNIHKERNKCVPTATLWLKTIHYQLQYGKESQSSV